MSTTVLTVSGQQARPIDRGLVPLWSVLAWEIRRLSASRLFWSQAIGLLGFLGVAAAGSMPSPISASVLLAFAGAVGVALSTIALARLRGEVHRLLPHG